MIRAASACLHFALCLLSLSTAALAAVTPSAPDSGVSARPFAEGIISTPQSFGASFSPDGKTFYFSRALPPGRLPTILCSHLRDGQWTEPEIVPIDGASGEGDAALSPDGSRLFFWSWRSAAGKPTGTSPIPDLWFVERQDAGFGHAHSAGETDSAAWTPLSLRHGGPSVAADGALYAFRSAAAAGGQPRLVRAPLVGGRYAAFEDLGDALNANGGGFDPYVAPDQRYVVFSSERSDSHGKADLYLSLRTVDGSWSTPRNLGPVVNSDAAEYEAAFSPDGRLLVFTRDRRGIFVIETAALGLDAMTRAVIEPASQQPSSTGNGDSPEPVASLFAEGTISTPDSLGAAFSPDGGTVYFTRLFGSGEQRHGKLMTSRCVHGKWSEPEPLPFSGHYNDFDPGVSPDGTQLFFSSIRPETARRPTLWMVMRTAGGWSTPQQLAAITGDDGVAVYPSVAASGNLYFAGHRSGLSSLGHDDIYVCRRQPNGSYAEPENLGPSVNSPEQDYDAFVAPDESFLIFCSRRPGGIGRSDFYVSVRENGTWGAARNLGPKINSATSPGVCCPSVSPDRKSFYFTSGRDGRRGIYRIAFAALGLPVRFAGVTAPDAVQFTARARPVTAPVLFGEGAVKGSSPTFSPDGTTVFTHVYSGAERKHTIMVSYHRDGHWQPSEVPPFSGTYDEMEPAFSADGRRLIFASHRPIAGRDVGMQLWWTEPTESGWSEPRPLAIPSVQPPAQSGAPSLAANGSVYFGQVEGRGWPWEIYCSRFGNGTYTAPVNLNDAINPGGRSWSHSIAPDESFLIYAGVIDMNTPRSDSIGDIDLYVSFRVNGEWQPGVNLGPTVNTADAEVWPRISRDGRSLFFNRQGPNARGIYQLELEPLLAPLRP